MATFSIESNGRLEKTAIYKNGEQLGGIKEVFLNMEEDGTFDAIIQYEGTDKVLYTKQIFTDYFENIKVTEPSFTEEESQELQILTVESDGEIENSSLLYNDEPLEGVVSIFIHIKAADAKEGGLKALFKTKNIPEHVQFQADITFRNEDDSIDTEALF